MIRYAARRMFGDWRRAVSMALVLILAVGSFLLLTGLVKQSQVRTKGTVAQVASAYDILVRPAGSPATTDSLLRPNSLSGTFGGISVAQLRAMRSISGVELAAPVAMVGETMETVDYPIDVTKFVARNSTTLLRFRTQTVVLRGSVTVPGVAGYMLVGPQITQAVYSDDGHFVQQLGSRRVRVCVPPSISATASQSPFSADNNFTSECWDTHTGLFDRWPAGRGRFVVQVPITFPVMIAAVDPQAEDQLLGLRAAMDPGATWLGDVTVKTKTEGSAGARVVSVPVIAADKTYVDQDTDVVVDRLGPEALAKLRSDGGLGAVAARKAIGSAPGTTLVTTTVTASQAHRELLHGHGKSAGIIYPTMLFQPGDVSYTGSPTSGLKAKLVQQGNGVWRTYTFPNVPWAGLSPAARTGGFRRVTPVPEINLSEGQVRLHIVGDYDPTKLMQASTLGRVPMETYQPPVAAPATDETAQLLGDLGLAPDGNPRGYLQQPPLLLVPLSALAVFGNSQLWQLPEDSKAASAPISAVRIRVAGAAGYGDAAQARVRLVADQIRKATGLEVEITKGSSPASVTVAIPSTGPGYPSLSVNEQWSKLGVATLIVDAIDRKTFTLLALVLVASIVAVGITATSAVRARQRELAVLACVGWRPRALRREVATELCLIGILSGAVGGLAAAALAPVVDVKEDPLRYLLAIPIAAAVAMAAGAIPAWRAGRTDPVNAVREAGAKHQDWRIPLRGVPSMSLNYLSPTPGRAVAAAVSLAFGVCALAVLLGVVRGFQGAVVGTVLGAAVTVQVRGPDLIAGYVLAAIGLLCLANVLYLDLREQAPRYATLQATGWQRATLIQLVLWQALFISTLGSLIGTLAAIGILQIVVGLHASTVVTSVLVGAAGIAGSLMIALIPAASLGRRPNAQLLSAD